MFFADTEQKPTLLRLRQQTTITTQQLAREAGVSLTEAYVVEIGGFGSRETAKKVIEAFARLSGQACSLDDIRLQNVSPPAFKRMYDLPTIKHPSTRQGS